MKHLTTIMDALRANLCDEAWTWVEDSLAKLDQSADVETDVSILSAMARRRAGSEPLGSLSPIETATGSVPIGSWPAGDLTRVLFVLKAITLHPDEAVDTVTAIFRYGDEAERGAIVRALSLFPAPESFKPLALEVGRANSLVLFSCLALDNPYPGACYTEQEFNQLVLKCLFLGLEVERVRALGTRANQELARMCEDYVDERLAANRSVPADIWLAIGPHATERGERLLLEHLSSDDPRHRHYAALAAKGREAQS